MQNDTNRLPRFTLRHLFFFVFPTDVKAVQSVCKSFRELINSDLELWKNWCFSSCQELAFLKDQNEQHCLPTGCDWKWLFRCLQSVLSRDKLDSSKFTGCGCILDTKIIYAGEWKDGRADGRGLQINVQTQMAYVGEFLNDQQDGFGILVEKQKLVYKGQWKNKKRCGKGIQLYANHRQYEGEWIDDLPNGHGVFTWGSNRSYKEQERYDGDFLVGRRNGNGTYFWPSGDIYIGSWKEGKQDGYGKYVWKTGSNYEGYWLQNEKHGHGVFVWPNGDRFEGEWVEGIPTEPERCTHPDIKEAILKKICTRSVAGMRSNLGQIYMKCQTCDIRVCIVCYENCHSTHNCPRSLRFWSSLNNCGCTCSFWKRRRTD